MNNLWLKLHKARQLSLYLNSMFRGEMALEDMILEEMWKHPWYEEDMWLNVDWCGEYDEYVNCIEIGVGTILV